MTRRSTPTLLLAAASLLATSLVLAAGAQEPGPHSLVHPVATPPPPTEPNPYGFAGGNVEQAEVCAAGPWTVYSSGANRINGAAVVGDRTWLATGFGVKVVDRKAGTVQHFTRLEGLPADQVPVIAADRDEVWCGVSNPQPARPSFALCRLDRKTGRWETLRDLPSNGGAAYGSSPTQPHPELVITPRAVLATLPASSRESQVALYVYDRAARRWDDVAWDPSVRTDQRGISVLQLEADGDSAWLATSQGLHRYNLRTRKWDRFLQDHLVTSITLDREGLWLTSRPDPSQNGLGGFRSGSTPGQWVLSLIDVKSGQRKEHPIPNQTRSYAPEFPSSVTVVNNVVWIGQANSYGSPSMPFRRLDLKSGQWSTIMVPPNASLEGVPDAVLLNTNTSGVLAASLAPQRFPGFLCPAEPLPQAIRYPRPSYGPTGSADGSWVVENARTLVHRLRDGNQTERFTLPDSLTSVNPEIVAVTHVGERPVLKTASGVFTPSASPSVWRRVRIPLTEPNADYQYRVSIMGGSDALWVTLAGMLLRYDLATDQFRVVQELGTGESGYVRIAAVTAGVAYLIDQQHHFTRMPLDGGAPTSLAPELPTSLRSEPYPGSGPQATALTVAGDIAWFLVQPNGTTRRQQAVVGYRLGSKSWTEPYFFSDLTPTSLSFLADGGAVYVAAGSRQEAPVQRYVPETNRWEGAAPALPNDGVYPNSLQPVSISAEHLLCVEPYTGAVWELNRKSNLWTVTRSGSAQRNGNTGESGATLAGNTLYVGTGEGIWSLDVNNRQWHRHSLPASAGLALSDPIVDRQGIWMTARAGNNANPVGVLRLSPATGEWQVWGENSGFPTRQYLRRLLTDGQTAWVLTQEQALRLNPRTEHWENVLSEMGANSPQVLDVAAEGGQAWLLLAAGNSRPVADTTAGKSAVLARYDLENGATELFTPEASTGGHGEAMLVEPTGIWVTTTTGYHRFDKSAHTWQNLQAPLSPPRGGYAGAERVARDGDSVWFIGANQTARLKER